MPKQTTRSVMMRSEIMWTVRGEERTPNDVLGEVHVAGAGDECAAHEVKAVVSSLQRAVLGCGALRDVPRVGMVVGSWLAVGKRPCAAPSRRCHCHRMRVHSIRTGD